MAKPIATEPPKRAIVSQGGPLAKAKWKHPRAGRSILNDRVPYKGRVTLQGSHRGRRPPELSISLLRANRRRSGGVAYGLLKLIGELGVGT